MNHTLCSILKKGRMKNQKQHHSGKDFYLINTSLHSKIWKQDIALEWKTILSKCSSVTSLCIYVQLTWAENALRWYVWYRFACFQISKNKFLSDVYKFTYENLKTTLCSWLEKLFCHNVRMGFRSGISTTKVHGFLIIDFPRFESKIFSQKSQECPKIEI